MTGQRVVDVHASARSPDADRDAASGSNACAHVCDVADVDRQPHRDEAAATCDPNAPCAARREPDSQVMGVVAHPAVCGESDPQVMRVEDSAACREPDSQVMGVVEHLAACRESDSQVMRVEDSAACREPDSQVMGVVAHPAACRESDTQMMRVEDPAACRESDSQVMGVVAHPAACRESDPQVIRVEHPAACRESDPRVTRAEDSAACGESDSQVMGVEALWQECCRRRESWPVDYAAYHHFRAKVRSSDFFLKNKLTVYKIPSPNRKKNV